MGEIAEAVQIVEVPVHIFGMLGRAAFETTRAGVELVKALIQYQRQRERELLKGSIDLDTLTRFEGNDLQTARFEDISMEQLQPVLEEYGIPYVIMPDTLVNGTHYSAVTFGNTYKDRMNAVIQHFGGRGEIIKENSVPKYISSGEVSLSLLMEQEGTTLMAYQFPEKNREEILSMMEPAGIKYAVLPDLNLNDGMVEIAYPASRQNMMASIIKRFQESRVITPKEYTDRADPDRISEEASNYDEEENWVNAAEKKVYGLLTEQKRTIVPPKKDGFVQIEEKELDKIVDECIRETAPADAGIMELYEARIRIRQMLEEDRKKMEKIMKESEKEITEKIKQEGVVL